MPKPLSVGNFPNEFEFKRSRKLSTILIAMQLSSLCALVGLAFLATAFLLSAALPFCVMFAAGEFFIFATQVSRSCHLLP
jgi:hypothetical protein